MAGFTEDPHFAHPVPGRRRVRLGGEEFDALEPGETLGYDDRGEWELGVFPLLIPAAKLAQFAMRVRQQRRNQQPGTTTAPTPRRPGLLRDAAQNLLQRPPTADEMDNPASLIERAKALLARRNQAQQPPAAPPSNLPGGPPPGAPRPPAPSSPAVTSTPAGYWSAYTLSGDDMSGYNGPPGPHRPRRFCRLRRRGNGQMVAYDPNTGDEVEVMGIDGEGGDYMGADDYDDDDDDFLGGEEEDDAEIFGAEEDADDLFEGADYDDDETFAGKEERLDRKLERLERRADKLRDKMDDMRGPFKKARRRRINKRLKKILAKVKKIRGKMDKARNKRKAAERKANATNKKIIAAAAGGAAVGTAAAAAAYSPPTSREGVRAMEQAASPLSNPFQAERMRRAQHAAGLSGNYRAPAGSGRLLPVPMSETGTTNPRNALTVPASGLTTAATLYAEDMPWIVGRLVGFMSSQRGTDTTNGAIALVEDLKIGGSGNLFVHEGPVAADYYDTQIDRLVALRASQVVKSPNQAQVDVSATGDQNDIVIVTTTSVYDVLYDDSYGAGFPGPY